MRSRALPEDYKAQAPGRFQHSVEVSGPPGPLQGRAPPSIRRAPRPPRGPAQAALAAQSLALRPHFSPRSAPLEAGVGWL